MKTSAEKKADKIKKLRDEGKSDEDIIADNPDLQEGYEWLKNNKTEASSKPKGSGPVDSDPTLTGDYGQEPRLPQLK